MTKPNEVLFRLHAIKAPDALGVEVINRNDQYLKEQHEKLGILPGEKVFATKLPEDRPWRLDGVLADMRQGGYTLTNINVEMRNGSVAGSLKPVLSLNFALTGETMCTPEQLAWVKDYLGRACFKLAMAYLNPRRDGTSQLAFDCSMAAPFEPGLKHLPLRRLLGLSAPNATASTPA